MKYDVIYIGPTGKVENRKIEADSISILDGVSSSLILFKKRTKIVFTLPQRSFVSAEAIPKQKAASRKSTSPILRAL